MARTQNAGVVKSMTGATFNPDRLKAQPDEVREMKLGTLLGRANDVCTSMGRDDEVLEGLKGMFLFQDADPARGSFKSYQFWPFSGMMSDLFDLPRKKEQVDFAFDIYAIRAGNPNGRSWKVVPLFEPAEADPMAEIARKASVPLAGTDGAPALVDGSAEAGQIAGSSELHPPAEGDKEPVEHKGKGGKK